MISQEILIRKRYSDQWDLGHIQNQDHALRSLLWKILNVRLIYDKTLDVSGKNDKKTANYVLPTNRLSRLATVV